MHRPEAFGSPASIIEKIFETDDGHSVSRPRPRLPGASSARASDSLRRAARAPSTRCRWNSLDTPGLKLFFSREDKGKAARTWSKIRTGRYRADAVRFRRCGGLRYDARTSTTIVLLPQKGKRPWLTFDDGLRAEVLMTAYMSAEARGRRSISPDGHRTFLLPAVARGPGSHGSQLAFVRMMNQSQQWPQHSWIVPARVRWCIPARRAAAPAPQDAVVLFDGLESPRSGGARQQRGEVAGLDDYV